jgi:hypothetical protein
MPIEDIFSTDDKKILEFAKNYIDDAWKHAGKKFKEREKYYNMYLNRDPEMTKKKLEWQTKTKHTFPHAAINQKQALYTVALLGTDIQPLFRALPWDNIQARDKASAYTKLLHQQLARISPAYKMSLAILDMTITGDAYLLPRWKQEIVPEMQDPETKMFFNPDGKLVEQKIFVPPKPRVIMDQPYIENIHPNNLWHDPSATSMEDARFLVSRHMVDYYTLKTWEAQGLVANVDAAKKAGLPKGRNELITSSPSEY